MGFPHVSHGKKKRKNIFTSNHFMCLIAAILRLPGEHKAHPSEGAMSDSSGAWNWGLGLRCQTHFCASCLSILTYSGDNTPCKTVAKSNLSGKCNYMHIKTAFLSVPHPLKYTLIDSLFFFKKSFIEIKFIYHTIHPFRVYKPVVFIIFRIVQLLPWLVLEKFHDSQKKLCTHCHPCAPTPTQSFPPTSPRQLLYFLSLRTVLFWTYYTNGIV